MKIYQMTPSRTSNKDRCMNLAFLKTLSTYSVLSLLWSGYATANPMEDFKKQIRGEIEQQVETSLEEVYHNPIEDADPAFKRSLDKELQPLGLPSNMGWTPPSPYLRYAHAAGELKNIETFIENHNIAYFRTENAFDKQDILASFKPNLEESKAAMVDSSTILFAARIDEHNTDYNFETGSFNVLDQELFFSACGTYRINVEGKCGASGGFFSGASGASKINMLTIRLDQAANVQVPKAKARQVDAVMRDFHNVSVFVLADIDSAGMKKTLTTDGEQSARMSGNYEKMASAMKQMNMPGMVTQEPVLSLNLKKVVLVDWKNKNYFVENF